VSKWQELQRWEVSAKRAQASQCKLQVDFGLPDQKHLALGTQNQNQWQV
jgi:hypothetical protein